MLIHRDLTDRVLASFYDVYNELGHGFLESVYENALAIRLVDDGLRVQQQCPLSVHFRGHIVGEFRVDLLVQEVLVLEVKAVRLLAPIHSAQVANYLKATGLQVGLLLNFGPRPAFRRVIF